MSNVCEIEDILRIVGEALTHVSTRERLNLLATSGLLTRLYTLGRLTYAKELEGDLRDLLAVTDNRVCENLLRLKTFAAEADVLKLRYAVVKGAPLSQRIYGSAAARACADIDIVVQHEDLAKAHHAALNAGFFQPMETFRARQLLSNGMLDNDMLKSISSSFPIRNSRIADHVAQYFSLEGQSLSVLEIHDSFHGLSREKTRSLLWNVQTSPCEDFEVPCLFDEYAFIALLLSAREDAEGILPNASQSDLGLALLFDIHTWLQKEDLSLPNVGKITTQLGIERRIGEILYDYVQVFPDETPRIAQFFALYKSPWKELYIDRLSGGQKVRNAVNLTLREAHEMVARIHNGLHRRIQITGASANLTVTVGNDDAGLGIRLIAPRGLINRPEGLLFNIVLIGFGDDGAPTVRQVSVYSEQNHWQIGSLSCNPLLPTLHPKRIARNAVSATVTQAQRDVFIIEGPIPETENIQYQSLLVSVCQCEIAGIYTRSFGDDYEAEIAEAVNTPQREGVFSKRAQLYE